MVDEQQRWVDQVAAKWDREAERAGVAHWRDLSSGILLHIAARHDRDCGSSFPPDNPDVGKVGFRVEVWPHDSGANGEEYHAGHMPAAEVARILRDIADRCDSWADPDCPWDGQSGHAPAKPPVDDEQQRRAEEAKRAAWEAVQ